MFTLMIDQIVIKYILFLCLIFLNFIIDISLPFRI